MKITNGITWITIARYVDIDTGEMIKREQVKRKEYLIIKRITKKTYNATKTTGYVNWTAECRRNQQGKLFN